MTLLQKLQTALSKLDGNTMTTEEDRGVDEYYCPLHKGRVYEDEYNHKHQCCFKCFYSEAT